MTLSDNLCLAATPVTPAAFIATQNNLDLGTGQVFRVSATTTLSITGFAGGLDGQLRTLMNIGANAITMRNNHANSVVGNKIRNSGGADIVLAQYDSITYRYDNGLGYWMQQS